MRPPISTACAAIVLGTFSFHAGSESRSWVDLEAEHLRVRAEYQVLSLLEVLPGLDRDQDGFIDAPEVAQASDEIRDYLVEHYVIRSLPGTGEGAQTLPMEDFSARLLEAPPGALMPLPEWIEVRWTAPLAAPGSLEVESDLFLGTSPDHRDWLSVRWPGRLPAFGILDGIESKLRFEQGPRRRLAQARAVGEALWEGGAGFLLVLALLLGWSRARQRAGHGLALILGAALGCAVLGAGVAIPGAHLLTLALPLGAAYCALDRALFDSQRAHGFEALGFGLLWILTADRALAPLAASVELEHTARVLALLFGCVVFAGLGLLALFLPKDPGGRALRPLLGVVGALGLGLFLLRAFG